MKRQRKAAGWLAMGLALLLLCSCQRVRVPQEELLPAGRPVEGVPADPKPDSSTEDTEESPVTRPQVLESHLCALLPGADGGYDLYDAYGQPVAHIPAQEADLAGVYPASAIVAGYRLADGSPLLADLSADAVWVQDDAGFTVWDRAAGLVHRLDEQGALQFSCDVPTGAALVSLLPMGRDFLFSAWWGDDTEAGRWQAAVAGLVLDADGRILQDLSHWLSQPVVGILGEDVLLVGRPGETRADAYLIGGECLAEAVRLLREADAPPALGGAVCRFVWKDGWICSSGLQPQVACDDPDGVTLCGEYVSGVRYDIAGVESNGELLLCGNAGAVWGVAQDVLGIQWQGINHRFPLGTRQYQRLQRCGRTLAVAYAWDANGSGCLRLLDLEHGAVAEYDCPASSTVSAALGEDFAVLAMQKAGEDATGFWVVDADMRLRYQGTMPLRPCAAGDYLLMQTEGGFAIGNLDGTVLISQ